MIPIIISIIICIILSIIYIKGNIGSIIYLIMLVSLLILSIIYSSNCVPFGFIIINKNKYPLHIPIITLIYLIIGNISRFIWHLPYTKIDKELAESINKNGLYHSTKMKNINSIYRNGFIASPRQVSYYEKGYIWFYLFDTDKIQTYEDAVHKKFGKSDNDCILRVYINPDDIANMRLRKRDGAIIYRSKTNYFPAKIENYHIIGRSQINSKKGTKKI